MNLLAPSRLFVYGINERKRLRSVDGDGHTVDTMVYA